MKGRADRPVVATLLVRTCLALLLGIGGLVLSIGGVDLLELGGSAYYLCAGAALLAIAGLVGVGRREALFAYGLLLLVTLSWAICEVGFDWWQLVPRGDLIALFGIVLLLPAVRRALPEREGVVARYAAVPLQVGVVASLALAVTAVLIAPQTVTGSLPIAATGSADGTPGADWPAYSGSGAGQRWSALREITPANIAGLRKVWEYRTGDGPRATDPLSVTFEVSPLKIGHLLYLCTPHAQAIALDAESGHEVWRFDPQEAISPHAPFLTCRGMSFMPVAVPTAATQPCGARLFLPTADARLIALDPETGRRCEDFGDRGEVDLSTGMPGMKPGIYYSTSPPLIAGHLVVIGGQVDDNQSTHEPSGVIRAYDGRTGALVWNWDAGRPDATTPLAPSQSYSANSPNSWSLSSYDPKLNLIYVPLGNQTPDEFGGQRPSDPDRLATSVIALDAGTGKLRWAFQTVHHDLWDMDVGSQPVLLDIDGPHGRVPALIQPTKTGNIFVLDRRTGKPLLPVTETPVPGGAVPLDRTSRTQPISALNLLAHAHESEAGMWGVTMFDQLGCRIAFRKLRYEGPYTPPSFKGTLVYPGHLGAFNWSGIAVDPVRQIAVATPNFMAYVDRLVPRAAFDKPAAAGSGAEYGYNPNTGAPYAVKIAPFMSALGLPCQAPPWGIIAGIDLRTGKVAWRRPNGTVRDLAPVPLPFALGVPSLGGPLATAGGVAFMSGTLDYYVRGYDVTTGRELWRARLPAGGQATPTTYRSPVSHRQYLIVAAGGYRAIGSRPGDYVIAYALPR